MHIKTSTLMRDSVNTMFVRFSEYAFVCTVFWSYVGVGCSRRATGFDPPSFEHQCWSAEPAAKSMSAEPDKKMDAAECAMYIDVSGMQRHYNAAGT